MRPKLSPLVRALRSAGITTRRNTTLAAPTYVQPPPHGITVKVDGKETTDFFVVGGTEIHLGNSFKNKYYGTMAVTYPANTVL